MKAPRILIAAAAIPLLAACQPGASSPTATPTTPAQTSASPSTPSQEELFRQASEVYRKISAEINQLEATGGARELPDSLRQYVTGELERNLRAVYVESWPAQQKKRTGPAPIIAWVRPHTGTPRDGAVSATIACVDARRSRYQVGNGSPTPGGVQREILHYAFHGGVLKAFDSAWEDTETC